MHVCEWEDFSGEIISANKAPRNLIIIKMCDENVFRPFCFCAVARRLKTDFTCAGGKITPEKTFSMRIKPRNSFASIIKCWGICFVVGLRLTLNLIKVIKHFSTVNGLFSVRCLARLNFDRFQ